MATKSYEVLVDGLTVLKQVGELTDPISGASLGIQQGAGKVLLKGEVVPASEVSPLLIEALEDEDHPSHESVVKKIREVGDEPRQDLARRLGLPFEGYDDLDEDDIIAALKVLPSATVQAVKTYEAQRDDPRERITQFSIGHGQSPSDRQEGRVGGDLDEDGRDDADKAARKLTTREVPEEGVVQVGDGITGTGDPEIPHGSRSDEDDDDRPAARRRGRRQRPNAKAKADGEGSGSEGGGDGE